MNKCPSRWLLEDKQTRTKVHLDTEETHECPQQRAGEQRLVQLVKTIIHITTNVLFLYVNVNGIDSHAEGMID